MQKNRYYPLSLIAAAILSGCSTVPPENASLSAAHSSYNSARGNAQVTKLAPIELQEAGNSLNKADSALSKGESVAIVNQLAYLAKQKVAIAQETAKRKTAELDVANASAKRNQVRLEMRTAEADAAKKRAQIAQQTADERAKALAEASAKSKRDQALISARMAELEEAKKQAAIAQQAADLQSAALAEASTKAEQDHALLAATIAEVEAAKKQAELAQQAASAKAEEDRALITQQEAQLQELQAKKTSRGMVITLSDVLFNTNQAKLSSGGFNNVRKLGDFLNKYPRRKVMIEGHTDSKGSDSYNQKLSERRADAVKNALVDMGIDGERVATRGYGESSPLANNETAAGRQMNRRVEIVVSNETGIITPR